MHYATTVLYNYEEPKEDPHHKWLFTKITRRQQNQFSLGNLSETEKEKTLKEFQPEVDGDGDKLHTEFYHCTLIIYSLQDRQDGAQYQYPEDPLVYA